TGAYAQQYAEIVSKEYIKRQLLESIKQGHDVKEVLATAEKLEKQGADRFFDMKQLALQMLNAFNEEEAQLTYPFRGWQYATRGIHKGEIVIIAGRPGMGKSTCLQQILLHLAKRKKRVLYASAEMSAKMIGTRLMSQLQRHNMFDEQEKPKDKRDYQAIADAT